MNNKDTLTPICDFVKNYIENDFTRLHMPGHKGKSHLGFEALDITEFYGADELYSPNGIILNSEQNATDLFNTAHTFYSTEGSSLTIKAMLGIATSGVENPLILAFRNVHKSFIYAAALLDIDVEWIYPDSFNHLCSCEVAEQSVEKAILNAKRKPTAVYITSPDYLGNIADIKSISAICEKHGIPLLVDNAHGAYLAFLDKSLHPIHLGAAMCADSAHKTLPVLTGGGYLHISKNAPKEYITSARDMLSIFASSSPSYLIMQSLDYCNKYLTDNYHGRLKDCIKAVDELKIRLSSCGYIIPKSEPLKLVIDAKSYGYFGEKIAEHLRNDKIEIEFFDKDYLVMMFTPENSVNDFSRLENSLKNLPKKTEIPNKAFEISKNEVVCSIRTAVFSKKETVFIKDALNRISATPTVACPPCIPIVMSGEKINESTIDLLNEYGIDKIDVICL